MTFGPYCPGMNRAPFSCCKGSNLICHLLSVTPHTTGQRLPIPSTRVPRSSSCRTVLKSSRLAPPAAARPRNSDTRGVGWRLRACGTVVDSWWCVGAATRTCWLLQGHTAPMITDPQRCRTGFRRMGCEVSVGASSAALHRVASASAVPNVGFLRKMGPRVCQGGGPG